MTLGIGSTVWIFDVNHRIYADRSSGSSSPIYREYFVPRKIVGETRVSWVLDHGAWEQGRKINKKTLDGIFVSQSEVDDAVFVQDNRHKLADRIRGISSASLLRDILALLDAPVEPGRTPPRVW